MTKYLFYIGSLLFCGCLQTDLFGQAATQIKGTVKSKQGVVQGAQVEFYDQGNQFQGNCISGPNGKFVSENKLSLSRSVTVRINAAGYKTLEKKIKTEPGGETGEYMLERKDLIITGFVRDSVGQQVLMGVQIFFYDEEGKMIQSGSTNSLGYFEVETAFTYGQKITIRIAKKGYYDDKEQTQTFTSEGRNALPDILIPGAGDRGLRAFIRLKDKKSGNPISGGTVRYFDKKLSSFVETPVPANGELELKLYQRPGTSLDLQVMKSRYQTLTLKTILSEEPINNIFTCELVKGR